MNISQPTALIADDNPAVREQLMALLGRCWPALRVVAEAANGADAWDAFLEHEPDVCFLDVRMPELTGIEVGRRIGHKSELVFTAGPNDPALAALGASGIECLSEPTQEAQVAPLVDRLRARLLEPGATGEQPLQKLVTPVRRPDTMEAIGAVNGRERVAVPVESVVYLEADGRFTRIAQEDGEARARLELKDLVPRLDPREFWQIHRFIVVNRHHIDQVLAAPGGATVLTLKGRTERLPVGSHFVDRFRPA